ncbi:MAG: hypothetical protein K2K21_12330 [Lachnospiraceae bacterium]|nr:hypothetical protein [Lachnospiraceae bacterium]
MKYHVSISKREIITAVILIIGLLLLIKGTHSNYQMNHALRLDNLDEHELKNGTYVTGDIDAYIGQIMYGSGKFSGVSQSLTASGKTYNFYTIPVGQKSYICIMAYSKSLLDQLEAFENGYGKNVYFEGIIVEPPTELNHAWYTHVEGFDTGTLIDSFVIKEVNFNRNKDLIYCSIILLAIAALLFFSSGGIKNFIMEETDNTRTVYNNYAKVYNKDHELQAEKMQLETLERRLKSAKRNAILCLALFFIGIYIVYSAYLLESKLFGILLMLISVRGIWIYFINSSNTLAKSLVKRFTSESLSIQIEEHKNNIKRLEDNYEI